MGLQVNDAVNHLCTGKFQLSCQFNIGLFIKPRLELNHGGNVYSCLCRFHQGLDNGRILAGAVKRLLDGDHVFVLAGLADELDHYIKAFIGVVNNNILF